MAEFDPQTFSEATDYTPTGATLTLNFTDGIDGTLTDTVELDPEWVAAFLKSIRTGNLFIRADGCLPVGSPELRPETKYHLQKRHAHDKASFQNWLERKPAV